MASTKEYRDFILEQLSDLPGISCRPMMGEFLLYLDGILFGGIYDDRVLVKIVPANAEFNMSEVIPYKGAKPMHFVEDVDDVERLKEIVTKTKKGLKMESKICQSCAMPLTSEDMYATEKDGSTNKDYCKWCYKDGEFVDKVSMEEYIEMCSKFGEQAGMTNEQMKEYCTKIFPTLKRWKQAQPPPNIKLS